MLYSVEMLKQAAKQTRKNIIEMAYKAGTPSHPAPSLSCADIVTALYYRIMRVNPEDPQWDDRDRFILSKGHACPALYAVLAQRNFFPEEWLYTLRHIDSHLQGHPDMKKTPGLDMTAGSLGNGLSAGLGMAYYLKIEKRPSRVYVLLGDGECQEGAVWEAAIAAPALRCDNLIAIVDWNHFQSTGACEDIIPMEPFADKWRAFNWNVIEINGHNMDEIVSALERAANYHGRPTVILAHTVKGKGVSFMEHDNAWHQKKPTEAEYHQALRECAEDK